MEVINQKINKNKCLGSTTSCGSNCGQNCGGAYLNDINSRQHYEGENVFVLQSTSDQTITRDRCGKFISELAGADKVVTVRSSCLPNFAFR